MFKEWMDVAASAAAGAVAFVFVFEGTVLLKRHGFSRTASMMLGFGLIYCLVWSGISYWAHRQATEAVATLGQVPRLEMPNENWASQLEDKRREEVVLIRASMVFVDTGKLSEYADASGQRKRFSPTEEDVRQRDMRVVTLARLEDARRAQLHHALGWLIWASVAGLLGMAFGSNKSTPANPTPHPDAHGGAAPNQSPVGVRADGRER